MVKAYYNENDPFAAAWLRELIKANLIAPGEVDERSIEEVRPADLKGFTQCHFFAGVGVWSYALRNAGWSDDSPVWTGSCPCQGFSASGQRGGFSDKRHLWPTWFRLIEECRPVVCFGEQVASKDGLAWLDVVSADLERAGYAFGSTDLCAAGFGAPHIRQRLYFVGNASEPRREGNMAGTVFRGRDSAWKDERPTGSSSTNELGNSEQSRLEGLNEPVNGAKGRTEQDRSVVETGPLSSELADSPIPRISRRDQRGLGTSGEQVAQQEIRSSVADEPGNGRKNAGKLADSEHDGHDRPRGNETEQGSDGQDARIPVGSDSGLRGPTNGFWRDAEWIYCRDGKYRPIKPGSSVLATGITNRVGKLRGYGNAINAEVAKAFIEAYLEIQ